MAGQRPLIATIILLLVFGLGASKLANASGYSHEGPVLLRNITIIDGRGHDAYPQRDVLISGDRIAKISVTTMIGELPEGLHVIDGDGLTVLPGLVDMHVHLRPVNFSDFRRGRVQTNLDDYDRFLAALIYAGVTSVFDMGNDQTIITQLRDEVAAGDRLGPRIFASGNNIPRLKSVENIFELPTKGAAEIAEILDAREADGIEMIKIYGGVTPWEARHIVHAAKKRGMMAVADFWCLNLSRDILRETGIDGSAHGTCHVIDQDEAEWMAANDRFAIPTIVLFENIGGQRIYANYETRGFARDPLIADIMGRKILKDYYDNHYRIREFYEDGENSLYVTQLFGDLSKLYIQNKQNARILYEAGVLMAAGTDAAFPPGTWFGESLHRELENLVDAGIPNVDVIQMGTHNAAKILRRDHELGSVEKGMIADLLIVEGNPAENIRDTRNIRYVIKEGKIVDRDALKDRWED